MDSSAVLTDLPLSRSNASFASIRTSSFLPPSISSISLGSRSCAKTGVSAVAGCDEIIQDSSKDTNKMTTSSIDSAGTTLPPIAISGTLTPPDLPDGSTLRIIVVSAPSSSTITTSSQVHSTKSIATLTVFVSTSVDPSTTSRTATASATETTKRSSSSSTSIAPAPITTTTLATIARTTTTTSSPIATISSTSMTPWTTFSALPTLSMTPLTTSFISVQPAQPSSAAATATESTIPTPATFTSITAPLTSQNTTLGSTSVQSQTHSHSHTAILIGLPVALGLAALTLALLWTWRRFAPVSFYKAQGKIPGYAAFRHWKDRRKRERRTRSLRTMEALSHSESYGFGYNGYNGDFVGGGGGGGDTFARRLKQYEQESMRAREKFSFEAPATPLSGGGVASANSISPWYKGKTTAATTPKRSVESLNKTAPGAAAVGESSVAGRRMYGPFKREFNEETGSLESWEEKWFSLGNEGESGGDFEMKSMKKPFEGHAERVAGPGMSWRKLV